MDYNSRYTSDGEWWGSRREGTYHNSCWLHGESYRSACSTSSDECLAQRSWKHGKKHLNIVKLVSEPFSAFNSKGSLRILFRLLISFNRPRLSRTIQPYQFWGTTRLRLVVSIKASCSITLTSPFFRPPTAFTGPIDWLWNNRSSSLVQARILIQFSLIQQKTSESNVPDETLLHIPHIPIPFLTLLCTEVQTVLHTFLPLLLLLGYIVVNNH